MTPTEQLVVASLIAAARVLWVRLGDATDADVNQLGASITAATDLLKAQRERK